MITRASNTALLLAVLGAGAPLTAQSPEADGLRIMREVEARGRGFGDMDATLRMTVYRGGEPRVRVLDLRLLEAPDADRTLMVLREPADLAGTAFLSIGSPEGERSQWIYLPSRRRVRRISGSQSSDPFLGSDFTYGDMDTPRLAGYRFRVVREEVWEGGRGVVVERRRDGSDDGSRELLWVDTGEYRVHRVEYLGAGGEPVRTLLVGEYRVVDGFPRPTRLEMRQAEGDSRTVLEWSDLRIGVGLSEQDFDPRRLGG
ncbi:MAG TPA: outer membrane lipoprotein-sorting protein [Longimicrobiales bacterium]|nr:outer membrane lipoprotein-sorting protein [Longimicrobiales bacterium]